MNKSETIGELVKALNLARDGFPAIKKEATNPFYNSKYATLDSIIAKTRPALKAAELTIIQLPDGEVLTTILYHDSGEWMSTDTLLLPEKKTPQGNGSAITYARRYGMSSILGVVSDDDLDGNMPKQKAEPKKETLESQYEKLTGKATTTDLWNSLGAWLKKKNANAKLIERYEKEMSLWTFNQQPEHVE